jgi:hypothetical protein
MGFSSSETLLIGTLLDRLGDIQAQALLERLDSWLQHDRDSRPATNRIGRRRAEIGIHPPKESKASHTLKD